ncbi:MAG: hypothetical protein ACI4K7_06205 [Oscillospiraceae bacterium]
MNMKKMISIAAAAVIGFTMTAFPACAESEEETEAPAASSTMCFDTDESLGYIRTFGAAEATGLGYKITSEKASSNGSLVITEDFLESSGDMSTGITFNCADFGLESLSGCTISLKVYAPDSGADELLFYSDGDVFLSESVAMTSNPYWETVTLTIPETINNTMFGMFITTNVGIKGEVCSIDELCLYKPDGSMAENIGDYKLIEEGSASGVNHVLMIIVFVLLIIAVVGCCAYVLLKFVVWRYR